MFHKDEETEKSSESKIDSFREASGKKPKRRLEKKHIILIVIIAVLLLALGGMFLWWYLAKHKTATPGSTAATKVQAPLDGVMTTKDAAKRHPLAIIVENHPDARPQVGLDKASVVYEAIAEGGITRYMALYGTNEADKVGPVRSARTYFVDWVEGYNAWLAHCGGNMDALDQIQSDKVLDLDEFGDAGDYWRESVAGIATEHTMYTDTAKLRKTAADRKYSSDNNFKVYKFKNDPTGTAKDALPQSQKVTVNFSTPQYGVVFDYDRATNSYLRSMGGNSDKDRATDQQLKSKNVVVMTVERQATTTRINENGYNMTVVGSGPAKIYIDGKQTDGTWKKDSKTSREVFLDNSGQEITFNRGQTWISVIPPEGSVKAE